MDAECVEIIYLDLNRCLFYIFSVSSQALSFHLQGRSVVRNLALMEPHPGFGLLKS